MPKSGVLLGAVIILHVQKTTLRYRSLYKGEAQHINRYESQKDFFTDTNPYV